jgi:plasmid stabilization system protein ParE
MGCQVIVTPQAIEDLDQIVRRIADDSPDRARAFGHALLDKALTVGAFPEMGRIAPEENDPAVREVIHGDYRIIYEIYGDRDVVYVLRFWHGARGEPEITRRQES